MNKEVKTRTIIYLFSIPLFIMIYLVNVNFILDTTHILLIIFGVILITPLFFLNEILHPIILFNVYNMFVWIDFYTKYISKDNAFRYYHNYTISDYVYNYSLLIIIVWFVSFYIGFCLFGKITIKKRNNDLIHQDITFNNPTLIGIILLFVSVLSFIYLQYNVGGIKLMVEGMFNRREIYSGLGYVASLIVLGGLSSIFFLIAGYRKISVFVLIISSLFVLLQGGRSSLIFGVIIPYIIVYNFHIKKVQFRYLVVFLPIILLIYEVLGNLRLYGKIEINSSGITDLVVKSAESRQMADILPSLISGLHDGFIEYSFGSSILNIIYAPVPRGIWGEKPIIDDAAFIGFKLMGEEYWGLPVGPYGWSYFNFSWIGVIVFAIFTGILVRKVIKSIQKTKNLIIITLYSQIFLSIFEVFQTSSQISIIKYIVIIMGIYLVDKHFLKPKKIILP